MTIETKETIKCTCGQHVEVARLKIHLQNSAFHWKGIGWTKTSMTAEELDALMESILDQALSRI